MVVWRHVMCRRHYDPFAAVMRQQSRQQRSSHGSSGEGEWRSNMLTRPAMAQAKRAAEEATDKVRTHTHSQHGGLSTPCGMRGA